MILTAVLILILWTVLAMLSSLQDFIRVVYTCIIDKFEHETETFCVYSCVIFGEKLYVGS